MNRSLTLTQAQPWLQSWNLPETTWAWSQTHAQLQALAAGFAPISLDDMDAVALLDRIDTKYVLSTRQLMRALAEIQQEYWMLSINRVRLNPYHTLYFDTPQFDLFAAHASGRAERYKVRSREYCGTHQSFLEVKHKNRKDRTIKERIPTGETVMAFTPELTHWLQQVSPIDGSQLEPKLWNSFTRMTLVSQRSCERVTLDVDIALISADRMISLGGIAVAEVKMDDAHCTSPFIEQMRAQRVRPRGFSKYAVGVAMLYRQVKKNALKPQLLWIEKMLKGSACYE
jgi:hypothetical protein